MPGSRFKPLAAQVEESRPACAEINSTSAHAPRALTSERADGKLVLKIGCAQAWKMQLVRIVFDEQAAC